MSETKAILSIIVGFVTVVLSLMVKQFYAARGVLGVTLSDRKIPRWQGRLLGLVVGGLMIFAGLNYLFLYR
jgi:hypothetical protein